MKRGDLITVSASGDYGKPRPAVVIQSDALKDNESVLVCLMTSDLREAPLYRLTLEPNSANGLKMASQVMLDKIVAVRRQKCGRVIGHIDDALLPSLNQRLAVMVGIAG